MFDRIVYISDHSANIRLKDAENLAVNLMNLHLVFEDKDKKVLGEVDDLDKDIVKARFLGEIVNGKLIGGTIRKPALDASIRVINQSEIPMIVGEDKAGYMKFGVSPFYNDFPVYLDVNNFFSNHFAILVIVVVVSLVEYLVFFKICFMIKDYFHIRLIFYFLILLVNITMLLKI